MSLTPEEVVKYIHKNEEENWLAECIYFGALDALNEVQKDLSKLDNEVHVERVLKPFLIQWGMMIRTLARRDVDWAQLGHVLRNLEPLLKILRNKSFLHIRFDDKEISKTIKGAYEELGSVKHVGATAVSKILHLMNPEIFVMWDEKICGMYNVRGSTEGYLEFLDKNQRLLEDIFCEEECNELRSKYRNKTLAKLIDEFNWYIANEEISAIYKKIKRKYGCKSFTSNRLSKSERV